MGHQINIGDITKPEVSCIKGIFASDSTVNKMIEYSLNLTNRETLSFTVYEKGCEPKQFNSLVEAISHYNSIPQEMICQTLIPET